MVTIAPVVNVYGGDTTSFYGYRFTTAGVPDNLSAWTWRAEWRVKPASLESLPLIVDASQANVGLLFVSASAATTALMEGPGSWDLQGTLGAQIDTPVRGSTTFTKDITRG